MNSENNEITFFEDLNIQNCPPKDSILPNGEVTYYRIVKKNPASSECFESHRKKNPKKEFQDECIARAVSIFDNLETSLNAYFKTPAGKKVGLVGKFILQKTDGKIKQTFSKGHYSWWRSTSFDISMVSVHEVKT